MTLQFLALFVEAVHPSFSRSRKAADGTPAASSVAFQLLAFDVVKKIYSMIIEKLLYHWST